MTPKAMLAKPVERRRGAVTQETGSWAYLLVDAPPDAVLDKLLGSKVIGAARRDCLADVRLGNVPRPVGPWGMLVRLKGQPWTYVLADDLRFEWPKDWAERNGWRVAWFSLDGMINTKIARLYDGTREVFNFTAGLIKEPEEGFAFVEEMGEDGDDAGMIRGEAKDVCSEAWLQKRKSGGEAMDKLAQFADAYLPVSLHHGDEEGKAKVGGWDGDPYPEEEEDSQQIPDDAFERVDVFTFGAADTLEPGTAAIALGKAVRAGDAEAARNALADGADPNVMYDDRESPLHVALNFGSRFLQGGRFSNVSLEQQLALLKVLLEGGANPDAKGDDPAIHQAIHWAEAGDERVIVAQLRLLLDHGADPNALGSDLRSAGQRPLHVVARFHQWLAVSKLLVSRGADAKMTNHRGETPRQLAEERLKSINESLAKRQAAKPGSPAAASGLGPLVGMMGAFAEAMTTDSDEKRKGAMKSLFGGAMQAMSAEQEAEAERLKEVVAFLTAAEQGTADVSDIDAVVAASSQRHAEAMRKEEEQKAAALGNLMRARDDLRGKLKSMGVDLNPPGQEKKGT